MKQLQALLYKEWRDQRVLLAGMYVLCGLLVVVARLVVGTRFSPQFREATILQACLAAVVVVLAVESVARDRQGRMDETLARLPIGTATSSLSKLLFVVLAAGATFACLALLEAAILLAEGRGLLDGLLTMIQPVWWVAIAAIAAACHMCARVLRRSLPSAVLGIALVVGIPFAASEIPDGRTRDVVDLLLASWTPASLASLLCAAFLLGSLIALRVRRQDPFGWRRAAGALLGVAIVLGPAFASSVRRGTWALDIVPFSLPVELDFAFPSPDGRHVALQVMQTWNPKRDWLPLTGSRTGMNCRVRSEIWILDLQTGELCEIDDRFRRVPCDRPWDARGRLATVSTPGAFGDGSYTVERIDPATATIVDSHPESNDDSLDYRYGLDRWLERRSDGKECVYSWRGTTLELRLPRFTFPIASPEPGVLFYEEGNAWVRYEFEGQRTRTLVNPLDRREPFFRVSPDGKFLSEHRAGGMRVIDAHDGHVVFETQGRALLADWSHVTGRIGYLYSSREGTYSLQALLEDGSLKQLPGVGCRRVCEFGPDRLLECRTGSLESVKLDGSERQVLYQARP